MEAKNPPPPPVIGKNTKPKTTDAATSGQGITKAVLFIGGVYYPFVEWLENKKMKKVLLTTPSVKQEMDFGTLKSYDVIETFENFGTNGLVEYRAVELHKKFNFSHVVCLAEEDMLRTARLRTYFGIKHGQDYESTLRFRDKVIMKQILSEAGINVPHFAVIENAFNLYDFIQKHGYPVVVKPRRGYGSVNTTVIKNEDEFHNFCKHGFGTTVDGPMDMMVEAFVTGRMYHVDGFVYDNEVKLVWPSAYVNTVVNFEENNFIAGYSLQPSSPLLKRIQKFMADSLVALKGPEVYPFHGEVWHTPDDKLVFCEVASRTGGGGIPTQILSLFGVILSKLHDQYQSGEPVTLETKHVGYEERQPIIPNSVGWIFIYPKIGKVTMPKNCSEPYVLSYEPYAQTGQVYKNRKSCADAVCNFLVEGSTEEETEANIHKIYNWFAKNTTWEDIQ
eukprot:TRINITY_DN1613_c0_g1_i1.p1 TRINITY_DN1613_c0_g1~~TRINITY_DN1613_c0_g1_i1.p1  ORF type:complete len:459 (-),score=77.92 TRINITY_DN1613_c0_g1_i1:696-2036(-)